MYSYYLGNSIWVAGPEYSVGGFIKYSCGFLAGREDTAQLFIQLVLGLRITVPSGW